MLMNNTRYYKSSSLSGVEGRGEHVKTFDTINTKHTPPVLNDSSLVFLTIARIYAELSELTISFFEMDNSIMSPLFGDVCESKDTGNNIITKHTPPLLHDVSCNGVLK